MQGYKIHFIRHAICEANEEGRYVGITESPVSARGREELRRKIEKYSYPAVEKVYVSPLKRCIATAAFIYPDGYARVIPELREMNFGDFEGKRLLDIKDLPEYKKFIKGGLNNPPPNGESMESVVKRCYEGLDFIINDMMRGGWHSAAVVTHGGIIMNTLSCFGLPKRLPNDFVCDFCEGYTVMATAQLWQLSGIVEIMGKVPAEKLDEETN